MEKVHMEKMSDFFTVRAEGYDEHMLQTVVGCKEAYEKIKELIPRNCKRLLDLGCGTGLELAGVFEVLPEVAVTGIDLTQAMLDQLKKKFAQKNINLICGSYFDVDYGKEPYDCAVSVETMHHFSHEKKVELYKKIRNSLRDGGMYIECDYMVEKQEEEDFYFAENQRIRSELGIPEGEFYHYDTPCTIDNQIKLFLQAGYRRVEKVQRVGNTTVIAAYR